MYNSKDKRINRKEKLKSDQEIIKTVCINTEKQRVFGFICFLCIVSTIRFTRKIKNTKKRYAHDNMTI